MSIRKDNQYINHTLNTSTFRKTCKFSTAPRFKHHIDNQTDFRYNIASRVTNRSTSFGVGPRPVMINSMAAPNPDRYNIAEFPNDKRCTSLGEGRQKAHFRSITYQIEKKTELPSPDAYKYSDEPQGKSFTLRAKLPGEAQNEIKKRVPGPGQYAQVEMNKTGKYYTSKIRNTRCISFGVPKKEYFKRSDTRIGPGTYDVFNLDSPFSQDKVNIMRRNTTKNFGTGHRVQVEDRSKCNIPGPGQYECLTSFGGSFIPDIN